MTPFPETIDRIGFAWYITGLTDGEGCFALLLGDHAKRKQKRPTPTASFVINLRDDDHEILQLIQSFFGCGNIVQGKTRNMRSVRFRTHPELKTILDHFKNFPLLAKKKKDFAIWKQGAEKILAVGTRRQIRSQRYGSSYKWTSQEHQHFVALKTMLSASRKYQASISASVPECNDETSELFLFR